MNKSSKSFIHSKNLVDIVILYLEVVRDLVDRDTNLLTRWVTDHLNDGMKKALTIKFALQSISCNQ